MNILKNNTQPNYQSYLINFNTIDDNFCLPRTLIVKTKKYNLTTFSDKFNLIVPKKNNNKYSTLFLTLKLNTTNDEQFYTTILSKNVYKVYLSYLNKYIRTKQLNKYTTKKVVIDVKQKKLKQIFHTLSAKNGYIVKNAKYIYFQNQIISNFKKWHKFLNYIKFKNLYFKPLQKF